MRPLPRYVGRIALTVAGILAAVAAARAETWTLDLKRMTPENGKVSDVNARLHYLYQATGSQMIVAEFDKDGKPLGPDTRIAQFNRIVNKEPKYESDHPFRGVVKFGSHEYAFVLDVVPPPPAKEDSKETKPSNDADEAKDAKPPAPKATAYNRLYFDFNHNGDLTDDKVIEVNMWQSMATTYNQDGTPKEIMVRYDVPGLDLKIDAGGTPLDYSFTLAGQAQVSLEATKMRLWFHAAVYREGEITLEGKKHHVVLLDDNSNGRFDDKMTVAAERMGTDKRVYPQDGDALLVDPEKFYGEDRFFNNAAGSPYEWATNDFEHAVADLINIDGRFYDVQISPAGDTLSLAPSSVATGSVTNPNGSFRATVYGDKGILRIRGDKDTPAALPEGQWRLLSYAIERQEPEKPKPAAQEPSLLQGLAEKLQGMCGARKDEPKLPIERRSSTVTAYATGRYKPVTVHKGETVVLPFGPPYTPTVTADSLQGTKWFRQLSLGMSLVGSAGEVCTNMVVNGGRPDKPSFTIADDKDKIVQSGQFEYG